MCRLFGFRSVIDSQVHRSLVSADNALCVQSRVHPHGWGVAYYLGHAPHVVKSASSAMTDRLFHQVSGIVSSQTVVAHIRRATQGNVSVVNSHPFQFGTWVFAHNGNVRSFPEHRDAIAARVPRNLRRFVLGETDSELFFHLLLGSMARRGDIHDRDYPIDEAAAAMREAVAVTTDIAGPMCETPNGDPSETYLTFLLTNGTVLLAHQGGQELFLSTHKSCCPERDSCPSYTYECENATESGYVNHFIVASERLQGENVWTAVPHGQIVGVDERMKMRVYEG